MAHTLRGLKNHGTRTPFAALLRLQFKIQFSAEKIGESMGLDRDKQKYGYLYLALIVLAFVPFTVLLFRFANVLTEALVRANQPGLGVIMAVLAGQFTVVFFGLSHLMSSLYYSSDLQQLQALPLTPWQIMYGKIAVVYVGQLGLLLFVVAPFLIALGNHLGDATFWPLALLVYLLIPSVPLGIGLLLLVPIMKVTAGARRRDTFRVLFGLVFVLLALAFQYLNNIMIREGPETLMAKLLQKDGLVNTAAGYNPLLKWAAWALTGADTLTKLSGLALYAAVSAGVLNAAVLVTQRWFLRGIAPGGRGASAASGTRVSQVSAGSFARQRTVFGALLLREHRIIARTPNFMLTALLNLLIVPILFASMYFTGGEEIAGLVDMMVGVQAKDLVVLILVGVHGMFTGVNQVASTAVSREGPMFWMSKLIPVPPKLQVRAKLVYSLLFACAQLTILAGASAWLFRLDVARVLVLVALGILVSIPVSIICLLNDLHNPKLNWTNPQQAMKGNFQTMVAWLFSMLYLGVLVLVIRGFYLVGISPWVLYAISGALLLVSGHLLLGWLDDAAEKAYSRL